MKITLQRRAMIVIMGFIIFGVVVAFEGYKNSVYPLEESRVILSRIQATSDPQQLLTEIRTLKVLLPKDGNPVWIFPTDATDFGLIQKDLDRMAQNLGDSGFAPKYNDFNDQMLDVHFRAQAIDSNLLDAIPYMFVSLSFVFSILVCIVGSFGLAEVLTRKLK